MTPSVGPWELSSSYGRDQNKQSHSYPDMESILCKWDNGRERYVKTQQDMKLMHAVSTHHTVFHLLLNLPDDCFSSYFDFLNACGTMQLCAQLTVSFGRVNVSDVQVSYLPLCLPLSQHY